MPDPTPLHEGRILSTDEWEREALARAIRSRARRAEGHGRSPWLAAGVLLIVLLLVAIVVLIGLSGR
jgi:hypothetical protein